MIFDGTRSLGLIGTATHLISCAPRIYPNRFVILKFAVNETF